MTEPEDQDWLAGAQDLRLGRLNRLESDEVNIQCLNSSDFVIGRQLNFNGPVTIVNTLNPTRHGEVVIRDKILSQAAAMKVQEVASRPTMARSWLYCIVGCAGLVIVASVTLAVSFGGADFSTTEGPKCKQVSDICIYPRVYLSETPEPLKPPLNDVIISQSNGNFCYDVIACLKVVEDLQRNNSGCNFLTGSDGNVYEDRGWNWNNALDGKSLLICLLGDYTDEYPTYPQVNVVKALIRVSVREGYVSSNYTLTSVLTEGPLSGLEAEWWNFPHLIKMLGQSEPESEVNIQCIQSSEFVIGSRTNFNGPVTIINCPTDGDVTKEKIVIRDKVLKSGKGRLENPKGRLVVKKLSEFRWILLGVCIAVAIVVLINLGVFLITGFSDLKRDTNSTHRIYSKSDWGGKPAKSFVSVQLPTPYVIISHTVTPRCSRISLCAPLIQSMQSYHFGKDYADISYNFLLDSQGNIYKGRGWTRRSPNVGFVNGRNIDVALIGDYSDDVYPTEEMMDGLSFLLGLGVERGLIAKDYSLIATNATYPTLSPGKNIYEIIKNWPHFDANPKDHVKTYED